MKLKIKLIKFIIFLALVISLIENASAYQQQDFGMVESANFSASEGYVIFSVYANDIVFKEDWSVQTFDLNAFGKHYLLEVKGRGEGVLGAWKHFYINLTYPNGTTVSEEFETLQVGFNDYDIKVQYYAQEPDAPLELDVYIYLNPLQAEITSFGRYINFPLDQYIVFNQISFASTDEARLEVYYCTYEEWNEIVENPFSLPAIGGQISNAIQEALDWARNNVPYASLLIDTFDLLYTTASGLLYYFNLIFIQNGLLTFTLFESFILAYSASASRNFFTFLRRYIRAHRSLFEFLLGFINKLVETIAAVVNALKPV